MHSLECALLCLLKCNVSPFHLFLDLKHNAGFLVVQEVDWQLQLASLIKEAVDAVTPDQSVNLPSSILSSVLDPLSSRHEQQATRTLLAAGLCQVMGFQPVLLRDTQRYSNSTLLSQFIHTCLLAGMHSWC